MGKMRIKRRLRNVRSAAGRLARAQDDRRHDKSADDKKNVYAIADKVGQTEINS
jgi:hypothetical protein